MIIMNDKIGFCKHCGRMIKKTYKEIAFLSPYPRRPIYSEIDDLIWKHVSDIIGDGSPCTKPESFRRDISPGEALLLYILGVDVQENADDIVIEYQEIFTDEKESVLKYICCEPEEDSELYIVECDLAIYMTMPNLKSKKGITIYCGQCKKCEKIIVAYRFDR
jgi:hypothetical protein